MKVQIDEGIYDLIYRLNQVIVQLRFKHNGDVSVRKNRISTWRAFGCIKDGVFSMSPTHSRPLWTDAFILFEILRGNSDAWSKIGYVAKKTEEKVEETPWRRM